MMDPGVCAKLEVIKAYIFHIKQKEVQISTPDGFQQTQQMNNAFIIAKRFFEQENHAINYPGAGLFVGTANTYSQR